MHRDEMSKTTGSKGLSAADNFLSKSEPQSIHLNLDIDELFPEYCPGNSILMEGFLDKRGSWNPAWQSRYFVLETSGRLTYYASEGDKFAVERAKGIIPINVNTTVQSECENGRCVIRIQVAGPGLASRRTFIISSKSKAICDQWLNKLTEMRDKVIYMSFPENVRHW